MAAITTFKTFTTYLAQLPVAGVKRLYENPPASLASADLPAKWTGLPRSTEPAMTFTSAGGWPALFCEIIIAIEPVGQSTQSANYEATIEMLDNLSEALRGASVGRAKITWEMNANVQVQVADQAYWAVMAVIEGR